MRNGDYFVKLARENGAGYAVDPRHSRGTDAAMMSAMACDANGGLPMSIS
jgi:hypothetical protein